MAHYVQSNLSSGANRRDRGVRQAGFLVLNATSMPSVLVELGYISNSEEAKFLASASGQKKLSECISRAFASYYTDLKKQSDEALRANVDSEVFREAKVEAAVNEGAINADAPIFKVQFMSSSKELPRDDKGFKGLAPIDCYYDNGLYKYTYGATVDYNEIVGVKKKVNEKFKDAFIVAFVNGERVDTQQAIAQFHKNNP